MALSKVRCGANRYIYYAVLESGLIKSSTACRRLRQAVPRETDSDSRRDYQRLALLNADSSFVRNIPPFRTPREKNDSLASTCIEGLVSKSLR